jgi:hypothetical protein
MFSTHLEHATNPKPAVAVNIRQPGYGGFDPTMGTVSDDKM